MSDKGFPFYEYEVPTIEQQLERTKLRELFAEGGSRYWAEDIDLDHMFSVLDGDEDTYPVVIYDEWGHGSVVATGKFTLERFRQGIIRRALQRWFNEYDSVEIDAATQLAVFEDIIFG